jgi:hypothetical protein
MSFRATASSAKRMADLTASSDDGEAATIADVNKFMPTAAFCAALIRSCRETSINDRKRKQILRNGSLYLQQVYNKDFQQLRQRQHCADSSKKTNMYKYHFRTSSWCQEVDHRSNKYCSWTMQVGLQEGVTHYAPGAH